MDKNQSSTRWTRDRILEELNALGVPAMQGSCSEVYLEKAFDGKPYKPKTSLPNAKQLGDTSMMFQVHPSLTEEQINWVAAQLKSVLSKATL